MIRQAVVLVGGLGTRLGALTAQTPKPLLEVAGRPFLDRLLDELARHQIADILLLAGFGAEQVQARLAGRPGVRVRVEPRPLGTGGALRLARDALDDAFFLLNGDSLFDINLWDLALVAQGEPTLALRHVEDAGRYGAAALDRRRITAFAERAPQGASPHGGPPHTAAGLINGGVGVLTRAVVDHIAPDRPVSLEGEVYPELARRGALRGRIYDRPFLDIGVPGDFARAQTWAPQVLTRGAVVFDRDGVLNEEVGYAHRPDQIVWVAQAAEAVKAVNDAGLYALVATNQAGVAHGLYGAADVEALHAWMNAALMAQGAHIDAFAYSPYHPGGVVEAYRREDPACRKPNPGMLTDLFARFAVDRSRTAMIGDRASDLAAAKAAGVEGLLFEGGDLMDLVQPLIARLTAGR